MQHIKEEIKRVKTVRRSPNAAAVAREVVKQVSKGTKVSMRKIIVSKGYSPWIASSPGRITKQEAYKEVVDPFIRRLYVLRDRITARMEKTISRAGYADAARSFNGVVEKIELLEGRFTSRSANMNVNIETGRKEFLDKLLDKNKDA